MDRTGTPAKLWLLCLFYVVFLIESPCITFPRLPHAY
jgi:hypothetical protein